jgi:hypothetical protein
MNTTPRPRKEKTLKRRIMKNDEHYIAWLEAQNRLVDAKLTAVLNEIKQHAPELYANFYTYGFGKNKRK